MRAPVRPQPKEISLHMSTAAYLRRAWPEHLPWTHFPAGEKRDARTGGKLKAMGLAPGWSDFLFILPNGQAAFLELKRPSGGLSTAQEDFRDKVVALRCGHATARSLDEVEQVITRWLAAFGLQPRATLIQRRAA
jgi:hypothetical protein